VIWWMRRGEVIWWMRRGEVIWWMRRGEVIWWMRRGEVIWWSAVHVSCSFVVFGAGKALCFIHLGMVEWCKIYCRVQLSWYVLPLVALGTAPSLST